MSRKLTFELNKTGTLDLKIPDYENHKMKILIGEIDYKEAVNLFEDLKFLLMRGE